jgi:hypothetical protein
MPLNLYQNQRVNARLKVPAISIKKSYTNQPFEAPERPFTKAAKTSRMFPV